MKKHFLFGILSVLITASIFHSCVDEIDFEQAENIILSPAVESSLFFINESASDFLEDDGTEKIEIRDTVLVEIFGDSFSIDNLKKADLFFVSSNTINRSFNWDMEFYDDNYIQQHTFDFNSNASTNGQEVVNQHIEKFEGDKVDLLKSTTNIVFVISLLPSTDGSIISQGNSGALNLQSKGAFYLEINTGE